MSLTTLVGAFVSLDNLILIIFHFGKYDIASVSSDDRPTKNH